MKQDDEGSRCECSRVGQLEFASRYDWIDRKDRCMSGNNGRGDIREQLEMQVDEIKAESLLPRLTVGAGIGRGLFGGVGSGEEPGSALQPVFVEVRRPLNEYTHSSRVEPHFDIATYLNIRPQRVRAFKEGARQADFKRYVR